MKIAVIIPTWNRAKLLNLCLQSLKQQTIFADVIVVDNGSNDDTCQLIETSYPEVRLIKLPSNLGFAGGVNAGLEEIIDLDYDAVAILNNDAIADKNWLKELVATLSSNPSLGAVGSKQMLPDGKHIDVVGNEYTVWGLPFPKGRNLLDTGQFDEPNLIFSAPGGASIYRIEMLKQIGLFDKNFFAYIEEDDLSFRAHLAGWSISYQPRALVYHSIGQTSSSMGSFVRYHSTKNLGLVYLKNMPGILFWKYLPLAFAQSLKLLIGSIYHHQLLAYLRGVVAFTVLIPHTLRQRQKIQSTRLVSSFEIDSMLYHGRPPKIPDLNT